MATSSSFTATVSAITDAFGDPTRRSVYLYVREQCAAADLAISEASAADLPGAAPAVSPGAVPAVSPGVTAAMVADTVGVHVNVARHHLDKLAAGGYLELAPPQASGGKAGRPSKRYRVGARVAESEVPVRADDLLLSLLGRALDRLPAAEAETMAEEVGAEYGRAMAAGLNGDALAAGQRSLRSAMQSVADALTAHGFAAHAERRNDKLRIINNHCPFGDVATEHPVICAVDRGMVRGMLSALYRDDGSGELGITTESSLAAGDGFCTTTV